MVENQFQLLSYAASLSPHKLATEETLKRKAVYRKGLRNVYLLLKKSLKYKKYSGFVFFFPAYNVVYDRQLKAFCQ